MNWFILLERHLVNTLLRSPTFHKGVQKVHKTVHQLQHGKPPPELQGGTQIDADQEAKEGIGHFFKLFWDEVKQGHKPVPKDKK